MAAVEEKKPKNTSVSGFVGTWKRLDDGASSKAQPRGRSSHSCCALMGANGKACVMVYGGEHAPREPINAQVNIFDWSEQKWTRWADRPDARVAHAAVAFNHRSQVLLFGGRTGIGMGEGALGDTHILDAQQSKPQWRQVANDDALLVAPAPRSYHVMSATQNDVFLFGGCTKERVNDLWCWDGASECWISVETTGEGPQGRGGACLWASWLDSTKTKGFLIVMFGFDGQGERSDGVVARLTSKTDPETGKRQVEAEWLSSLEAWLRKGSAPGARSVLGFCALSPRLLFVYGGEKSPSSAGHAGAGTFWHDGWILEFSGTEDWSFLSKDASVFRWHPVEIQNKDLLQPKARGWTSCCCVCSDAATGKYQVALFGGLDTENQRLDDFWTLHLTTLLR